MFLNNGIIGLQILTTTK